jgi:hypothetical protein
MAITVYEAFPSREFTAGGDNPSINLNWIVLGTTDELEATNAALAVSPVIYDGLFYRDMTGKETAPGVWECQARTGPASRRRNRTINSRLTRPAASRRSRRAVRRSTSTPPPAKRLPIIRAPVGYH